MKILLEGNIVKLCKYKITYKNNNCMINEFASDIDSVKDIIDLYGGTYETLDTKGWEWLDGIQIPETNRPMEKALEIAAMGEEGYKKWLEQQAAQSPENLAAENAQLKQQLTDTQLALVEVYEMMLPS